MADAYDTCGDFPEPCANVTQTDVFAPDAVSSGESMLLACLAGAIVGLEREYRLHLNRRWSTCSCERDEHTGRTVWFNGRQGYNRRVMNHTAGLRTHMLVAVGACLFTLESQYGFSVGLPVGAAAAGDPARVAAQIVSGIGFLGGGAIMKSHDRLNGLTTAASIWLTAALGMAAGSINSGVFWMPVIVALAVVILLQVVGLIETSTHTCCNRDADKTFTVALVLFFADEYTALAADTAPGRAAGAACAPGRARMLRQAGSNSGDSGSGGGAAVEADRVTLEMGGRFDTVANPLHGPDRDGGGGSGDGNDGNGEGWRDGRDDHGDGTEDNDDGGGDHGDGNGNGNGGGDDDDDDDDDLLAASPFPERHDEDETGFPETPGSVEERTRSVSNDAAFADNDEVAVDATGTGRGRAGHEHHRAHQRHVAGKRYAAADGGRMGQQEPPRNVRGGDHRQQHQRQQQKHRHTPPRRVPLREPIGELLERSTELLHRYGHIRTKNYEMRYVPSCGWWELGMSIILDVPEKTEADAVVADAFATFPHTLQTIKCHSATDAYLRKQLKHGR